MLFDRGYTEMKLKDRLKLHMFWIGLVSLILMLINNISSSYFGVDISLLLNKIEQTVCILLSILLFLGVLSSRKDRYLDQISDSKDNDEMNCN